MSDLAYHIIVVAVAAVAVVRGFREGLTGQVCGVLGFAFGVVSARVFGGEAEGALRAMMPGLDGHIWSGFVYSQLACCCVYIVVYLLFRLLTGALKSAMSVFEIGILDSVFGSVFCLLKYMVIVSVAFNLLICVNPESRLVDYTEASDGNVVEAVVMLAPSLIGSLDADDLAHRLQLEAARKIS